MAPRPQFRIVGNRDDFSTVKVQGMTSLRSALLAARYYDVNDGYRHDIEQSDDGGKTWRHVEG